MTPNIADFRIPPLFLLRSAVLGGEGTVPSLPLCSIVTCSSLILSTYVLRVKLSTTSDSRPLLCMLQSYTAGDIIYYFSWLSNLLNQALKNFFLK